MDRKRHFPALGHVDGNSATISVSGWKMVGKAQHVIQKGDSFRQVEERDTGTDTVVWFCGSSTVSDHYCHLSTAETRHLLSAQQNSLTEELHLIHFRGHSDEIFPLVASLVETTWWHSCGLAPSISTHRERVDKFKGSSFGNWVPKLTVIIRTGFGCD